MSEIVERIEEVDITDIAKERFANYVQYVLADRAFPDLRDGMKPVQRRIMYAMGESNNTHDKPYRKSARAVGDVMGKYHPHGDCLRGDTKVKLLNGEVKTMEELYKDNKDVEVLAVDKNNNIVPTVAHSFRIGQFTDKVYAVKLSNGLTLEMTGNHPVLLASNYEEEGHIWTKAENLKVEQRLYSGYISSQQRVDTITTELDTKIVSIKIEEVDQEPMYDFTVDEHENMLLIHSTEGNYDEFIVVHNSSIYEALVRLSKDWVLTIPLIDMQGNNGSMDGDSPASMRYTEARLSKIVSDHLLKGIRKKGIVPMVDNYDDTEKEPEVLPVHFPSILTVGVEGIGVGYATSIPTFNLTEVLKGLVLLLQEPDTTDKELFSIIPSPDFPTKGVITGGKDLLKVLSTGQGRVRLRSNYRVKQKTKRMKQIIFDDIPYNTNKSRIIMRLDSIVAEKKVNGLLDARDESGREGTRIVLDVDNDVELNVVLGYIFQNTDLQVNINLNMMVSHENKPKSVGVFDVLREFNEFRRETTIKELEYDLRGVRRRKEIVEGFIKLSGIVTEVVATIRESDGRADAKQRIISEYEFTELQAENIVSMALHRISRTDKEGYMVELKELERKESIFNKLLTNPTFLTEYMIRNYTEIIQNYGYERQTEVIQEDEDWTVRKTDVIQEEDTFIGVSREGYIKRSNRRSFNTTSKNGLIEGDEEILVEETTTKKFLMLFTNSMEYFYVPIHEIEETRWGDTGKHLSTFVNLKANTQIVGAFTIDEDEDLDKYILTLKSNGLLKRTTVREHVVTRYMNMYEAIKGVGEEDELIGAYLHDEDKEYFIGLHSSEDRTLAYSLNNVAPKGLRTQGMRGIHVGKNDVPCIKDHFVTDVVSSMPSKYAMGNRGTRGRVLK